MVNLALGSLLAAALVWLLLMQSNPADILHAVASISLVSLVSALLFYLFSNILRALRFKLLVSRRYCISFLLDIVHMTNLLYWLLPGKSNEIAYVYLMKRSKTSVAEGIASIIVARIFDFFAIITFFLIAIFFIEPSKTLAPILWTAFTIIFLVAVFLALFITFENRFVSILVYVLRRSNVTRYRFIQVLVKELQAISKAITKVKSRNILGGLLAYSYAIWFAYFIFYYILIAAVGIKLTVAAVVVGITLNIIAATIPVKGIGSLGTYEGYWTLSFILLGVSKELAIASSFATHAVSLLFAALLGIYSFIRFRTTSFQKKH